MKRRLFLKSGFAALAVAGSPNLGQKIIPGITGSAYGDSRARLPIPKLLENLDKSGETGTFAMEARQGTVEFLKGKATATMGYNGDFLGPTIRVRNGQRFKFSLKNTLPEVTTLHWHGLHVPAQWDGGPRQPVAPGTTWKPDLMIRQEAATLWYHPHAMGLTGKQVYKGLAGFFLIEDDISDKLDIPKTYGVDDIPLVIQDRRFFKDGRFAYVQSMHDIITGVVGNNLLVNGALHPTLKVHSGLVRLRILNGSNSSIYRMAFSENRPFQVIASDGGFLERPAGMNSIVLSAGERVEVLIDFSGLNRGSEVRLRVEQMGGRSFDAMKIVIDRPPETKSVIPATLRKLDRIPESAADNVRKFVMETMSRGLGMMGGRLTINGKRMDINRIDERIKAGSTEIWEISNQSGMMMNMPHSMHLHDVQFQILSRNGQTPQPHERGRKDTVLILPGESIRI
ncbi:MAG: multicopper oxidase domain-containing protein, partial [Nitrospina sp.]|nr:multicopper oxidase domain-containing protein [Nitrospina sp.]